jgi:hypothetical protein
LTKSPEGKEIRKFHFSKTNINISILIHQYKQISDI